MGANATTFVPSYTSGEVLTAANLSVTNSGIPVFATTVTRDAAFGGTGEKTLAEGQFAYIEATNTTQYYDGAAWQSVGVAPGLVYITGASFTAAATVSLPTDSFTTTYDNYRLMVRFTAATAADTVKQRWRTAGTDNSAADYQWGYMGYENAFEGLVTGGQVQNVIAAVNTTSGGFNAFSMDIYAPKLSAQTYYTLAGHGIEIQGSYTNAMTYTGSGRFNATTVFDSMSIFPTSGTITGSYKLYGYSNS
jgi:hypothetical protein